MKILDRAKQYIITTLFQNRVDFNSPVPETLEGIIEAINALDEVVDEYGEECKEDLIDFITQLFKAEEIDEINSLLYDFIDDEEEVSDLWYSIILDIEDKEK